MNKNKIISWIVKSLIPIPFLNDILIDIANKHKLLFTSLILFIMFIPIIATISVFGGNFAINNNGSREKFEELQKLQYFNVFCRENKDKCEAKEEFKNQNVDCGVDPGKCRKVRTQIDCSKMAERCDVKKEFKINCKNAPNKCLPKEEFKNQNIDCNEDSGKCRVKDENIIDCGKDKSKCEVRAGENEKYYKEQENEDFKKEFKKDSDILNGNAGSAIGFIGLPKVLETYVEPGFVDSGTPHLSPFGGNGNSRFTVTCPYLCRSKGWQYPAFVKGDHLGFDHVPNANYYKQSKASQLYDGKPVAFATCSGVVSSIFDTAGGNIVRVKCGGNDLTVTYFHLAEYFIPKGSIAKIIAGQPIGVMGSTGAYTTGAHMHYGIQKGCMAYSEACTIDPEPFIYKKITIN